MSEWIWCPKCGALMNEITNGHICPLCGYRVPAQTITTTTGTFVEYVPVIRCKDCKYYRNDGDCWHEWDNDGRIYYQSIIEEPNPDDYCSRGKRKE